MKNRNKHLKKYWPMNVLLKKIKAYIDRRARVKGEEIHYSLYDYRTRKATKKVMGLGECTRVFNELYPTGEG